MECYCVSGSVSTNILVVERSRYNEGMKIDNGLRKLGTCLFKRDDKNFDKHPNLHYPDNCHKYLFFGIRFGRRRNVSNNLTAHGDNNRKTFNQIFTI
jgi:hypothetical protein